MCVWAIPATAVAKSSQSPLRAHGIAPSQVGARTDEEKSTLEALRAMVHRLEESAKEYQLLNRESVERRYKLQRNALSRGAEERIQNLEREQRDYRTEAIARFEGFIERYPKSPVHTPDVLFRLAELYFERSYDTYVQQRSRYELSLDLPDAVRERDPVPEPKFNFDETVTTMQRLISSFPNYRLVAGAYYLKGFCLSEQGEEAEAVEVFEELNKRIPDNRFAAEVWTRIGEFYFSEGRLQDALRAFSAILPMKDSPFYDKALYKLAWTHYRLADAIRASDEYKKAVDTFVALLDFNVLSKTKGKERGADLRGEAIQYIALSFSDESWGGYKKLIKYLDDRGEKPYTREVLIALGDIFFEQTRFSDASAVYRVVQERYPMERGAPSVQDKLIQAYERDRNFETSAEARRALVSAYTEGSPWYKKHTLDTDALAQAEKFLSKSIYSAAIFYHKQAQVNKDANRIDLAVRDYGIASGLYAQYLERFPQDPQVYELTYYYAETLYYALNFAKAAEKYAWVRDVASEDKFREVSAFSVVLSYQNQITLLQDQGKLAPLQVFTSQTWPKDKSMEPMDIPRIRENLVDASDVYARMVSEDEKLPSIMYRSAETLYAFGHFEEARKRFTYIIKRYPSHEVSRFSANLVIESYLLANAYVEVAKYCKQMLAELEGLSKKDPFRLQLAKFMSGADFKIAEKLSEEGKFEEAARLYIGSVDAYPEGEYADLSLNNAAVDFEKIRRYDSASKVYERLAKDYPKSSLVDAAIFRTALNSERFFDFDRAIVLYLRLVDNYPKSAFRADATYNAALALENRQQYDVAAKQYLRYCELFPTREDAPEVCFRAGLVYEKMGKQQAVIDSYRAYISKYRANAPYADRIIEAHIRIATALGVLGRKDAALDELKSAVNVYSGVKDPAIQQKASAFAAEAEYKLIESESDAFDAMAIVGDSKKQQEVLVAKAARLQEIQAKFEKILRFKHIEWTLASLYRIGRLYENFAESLNKAPCPPDVAKSARDLGVTAEEVCDEYRILLEERSAVIEDKAVQAFETTVEKGREFQVVNTWTQKTLVSLNKLRKSMWPLQKDAKVFVDLRVVATPRYTDAKGEPYTPTVVEALPLEALPAQPSEATPVKTGAP